MGKRKDCWNEGEEAQGFKEFPCKDDDQGRCACDLEELAEISLAFAREVAGHPDAYWVHTRPHWTLCAPGVPVSLPDYTNDWNATIAAVEARGWTFQVMSGRKMHRDATVRNGSGVAFYGHGELDAPRATALCLAAIKCVRESKE